MFKALFASVAVLALLSSAPVAAQTFAPAWRFSGSNVCRLEYSSNPMVLPGLVIFRSRRTATDFGQGGVLVLYSTAPPVEDQDDVVISMTGQGLFLPLRETHFVEAEDIPAAGAGGVLMVADTELAGNILLLLGRGGDVLFKAGNDREVFDRIPRANLDDVLPQMMECW